MSEYQKQAKDFLNTCNATMEIEYAGLEKPIWDDKPYCAYDCIIKTPKGNMTVHFYDSAYNTELRRMNAKQYYEKLTHQNYDFASIQQQLKYQKELKAKQKEAIPTEYDILACLEKYDVGSMDDFMGEFGYEIHSVKDMTNFINTYNAVVKEYNDLCRIFTPEQMEMLREIY